MTSLARGICKSGNERSLDSVARPPPGFSRVEYAGSPAMDTDATPAETAVSTESAHTTSRKSAPNLRMDLIPRGERRRRWTTEQKQTIAAQSLAPGASPTNVARLKLPRFCGHRNVSVQGVRDGQNKAALCARVPAPDG